MKALRLLPLALAVVSCGGPPSVRRPADTPASVTHTGTGTEVRVQADVEALDQILDAPPAQVWAAVQAVYGDVGIDVTERDPAARSLGNPRILVGGRFLDRPMAHFLNCGQGATGLHANVWRVEMSVRSVVSPSGEGKAKLGTLVEAIARNMEGTSNNRVPCTSYHRLEAEILSRVKERLNTGS